MEWLKKLVKGPVFKAALIGAFGGMAPKLITFVPQLFGNNLPTYGACIALLLLALFGFITVVVYQEQDFKKALALGAGAPAIIASLTTTAVGPSQTGGMNLFDLSFPTAVYAQEHAQTTRIKLVLVQNESAIRTNSLWLRGDEKNLTSYWTKGDTLIFDFPSTAKDLRINLPGQKRSLTIPRAQLSREEPLHLKISNNSESRDFWKTFGGAESPKYEIEVIKKE